MLTDFFLNTLDFVLLTPILFLLGSFQLPSQVGQAFAYFADFLWFWDSILPVSTLLTILALVFSVHFIVLSFRSLVWIRTTILPRFL